MDVRLIALELGPQLGSGGQGKVHRVANIPGQVLKRYYHQNVNADSLRELVEFPASLDEHDRASLLERTAWPDRRVTDGGRVIGFLMQEAPAHFLGRTAAGQKPRELQYLLYQPKALWGDIRPLDAAGRIRLAQDFVSFMRLLHRNLLAIGDISMTNVLWSAGPPVRVFVIDCDGIRRIGHPPVLRQPETPGWEDPQMPRTGPDLDTDSYKVALVIGRMLAASSTVRPGEPLRLVPGIPDVVAGPVGECFAEAGGKYGSRPTVERWARALSGREMMQVAPPPPVRRAGPALPQAPVEQKRPGQRDSIPVRPVDKRP